MGPRAGCSTACFPRPEGPDEESRRRGFFRIEVHARTTSGRRYVSRIAAQATPGMRPRPSCSASALCLALDRERLPDQAGVLTPATAMGDALADRLRAAGQTFEAGAQAA